MDWDALKVVLALERTGSLSRAALELDVTHPTVSRKLNRLQDDLGVRLFERTPTGWQATEAGEQLLEVARQIEAQVVELDRALQGRDVRLSGLLRVWTVEAFARAFCHEVEAFVNLYPNITLELQAQNNIPSLAQREVDVLLTFTDAPPEQLIGYKLGPIGYALYGAESLLERAGWDEHRDWGRLPWLAWHPRAQAKVTARWMRRHVPNARITCTLENSSTMVDYVIAGLGVMFMPCFLMDGAPGVRRLTGLMPDFAVDLWLLHHPDLKSNARVGAFMQFMRRALLKRRAHIAGVTEAEAFPGAL